MCLTQFDIIDCLFIVTELIALTISLTERNVIVLSVLVTLLS